MSLRQRAVLGFRLRDENIWTRNPRWCCGFMRCVGSRTMTMSSGFSSLANEQLYYGLVLFLGQRVRYIYTPVRSNYQWRPGCAGLSPILLWPGGLWWHMLEIQVSSVWMFCGGGAGAAIARLNLCCCIRQSKWGILYPIGISSLQGWDIEKLQETSWIVWK